MKPGESPSRKRKKVQTMAAINFDKAVQKTIGSNKIPGRYFMDSGSMKELMWIAKKKSIWDAINKAFCAGIVAGNHATLKHGLRRL